MITTYISLLVCVCAHMFTLMHSVCVQVRRQLVEVSTLPLQRESWESNSDRLAQQQASSSTEPLHWLTCNNISYTQKILQHCN